MKKLKHFSLFSGIEAFKKALTNLGIDNELVGYSEFDKYASVALSAVHGVSEELNYGDITKIDETKVPDCDLITYGFPCFTKDNLVLTEEGYKPINEVVVGDKVLTHNNTYEKVVKTFDNGIQPTVKVKAMGIDEIVTTPNHKFYVREKYREWNNDRRSYDRLFKEPQWKEIKDVTKDYYLGMAVNQKSEIPKWNGITFHWVDGRKPRHKNELQELMDNQDFWWIVGRYLADGWTRTQGGIVFGIGKNKASEFENRLGKLFNYSTAEEKSVVKYHVPLKELSKFVEQFGKGAANKKLSKSVLNLPIDLLESFLEGYFSGDGSFVNGYWKANSVSRELMLGIGQAVMKVYKRPYSLYKDIRPKTTVIEGRTVNQKDTYSLSFKKEAKKQDNAFYEDGYVWIPFNAIEDAGNENVYDIEVNSVHSFTVQNVIVHNCQDISVAGLGKGIVEGETRSGLLYDALRIIEHKMPKYAIAENVKNLVGKKFKEDFEGLLAELDSYGYNNYYKVLNAKDYGIPQNRERVFIVSIRKDIDTGGFKFPEPSDSGLRLKDLLEDEVEEKYYIDNERTSILLNNLKDKEMLPGGINVSKQGKVFNGSTEVASCLLARDYKGLGNQSMTAVAEPIIVASRGRNPNNPSDRTTGSPTEQRLERNSQGIANTLTTVQKDNLVLEPKRLGGLYDKDGKRRQAGAVWDKEHISPTIDTCQGGHREPLIIESYRIRKLTPKECWRLMGFTDEDYFKARQALEDRFYNGRDRSNSQMYKMAGNSIVVDVLEGILKNLL